MLKVYLKPWHFGINSTLGVAGLFYVANKFGFTVNNK